MSEMIELQIVEEFMDEGNEVFSWHAVRGRGGLDLQAWRDVDE